MSDKADISHPGLPAVRPPSRLYRIHRASADGLDLPPWEYARAVAPDGGGPNFGGRWDDPHPVPGERFRTLSLGDDPIGVALEVLQSLRPDPTLAALEAAARDPEVEHGPRPTINVSDLTARRMSTVELDPDVRFLDVTNSKVRAFIEARLEPMLDASGITTLKIGDLLGTDTALSQRVAELVHDTFPGVAGIATPSALGTDFRNFYVFEAEPESGRLRAAGRVLESHTLSSKDPEIRVALSDLRLDIRSDIDAGLTIEPEPVPLHLDSFAEANPRDWLKPRLPIEFNAPDMSTLPIFRPNIFDLVSRREDALLGQDQTMSVLGRSEDGQRVLGRQGAAILSVSAFAFSDVPRPGQAVTVRCVNGLDQVEPVQRESSLER
jgi:hypothetical protein